VKTETVAATLLRGSQTAAKQHAIELLRKGEVVALPTETVYGLAADALNPVAVAKIFDAKERPRFDPLIVHLPGENWLERVAKVDNRSRAPVFAGIISAFEKPLAAPSANRFGRISPTTAQHAFDELSGRIPLIIDAGPSTHGVESTIIAVHDNKIHILRRGPITAEQLAEFGKIDSVSAQQKIFAPGQLPSHYSPKTPFRLIDNAESFVLAANYRVGLLAWNAAIPEGRFAAVRTLSERQDLREAAANLFRYLRELDELDHDLIVAERVPAQGLGAAILDRLERASHDSDIRDTPE